MQSEKRKTSKEYTAFVIPSPFRASVISGAGRGKALGTPTINLDPSLLAHIGREGIYACWAIVDDVRHPAVMHAGARPVFNDTPSIELHLLDTPPATTPTHAKVEPVAYLRAIRDFPSVDALKEQIRHDIHAARATLDIDAPRAQNIHP